MPINYDILTRKAALTDSFAAGLREDLSVEELEKMLADCRVEIVEYSAPWKQALDAVLKPAIYPAKPELLPVTAAIEAREDRIKERREWEQGRKAAWEAERIYKRAIAEVNRKFQPISNLNVVFHAAAYLWLKDVQTTPISQLTGTAFFGIVGYWLRAKEAVNKRGYLFNSDNEKWVVGRELESRKDEWM